MKSAYLHNSFREATLLLIIFVARRLSGNNTLSKREIHSSDIRYGLLGKPIVRKPQFLITLNGLNLPLRESGFKEEKRHDDVNIPINEGRVQDDEAKALVKIVKSPKRLNLKDDNILNPSSDLKQSIVTIAMSILQPSYPIP